MEINFYPKDPVVLPLQTLRIPETGVRPGPADDYIVVTDHACPQSKPDKRGNFLYRPDQFQFDGCEAFGVLTTGMMLYERTLKREIPFAFSPPVGILPHDGEGINAFYSRDSEAIHFLDMSDPRFAKFPQIKNKTLRMAQSLDVAAHEEVGHLLLDGLKPEYLNLELETQAFHEAFGDISSMIMALQFDSVLDKLLEETGGNLRQSNVVTRLGAEAGMAIQALSPNPDPDHFFLRDAIFTMKHDWKYKPSEELSEWVPREEKKLGVEPHNFSRFFSGLWYEIFVNLFEHDPARSLNPKQALKNARDIAASLILRGTADFAPETTGRFPEIAKGILQADRADCRGAHEELLAKIFIHRKVLDPLETGRRAVPLIRADRDITSRKQAVKFLKEHERNFGLEPGILYEPSKDLPAGKKRYIYRNGHGETFLTFHSVENRALDGGHFNRIRGANYEVKGSLKLGFDANGNLFHLAADNLTAAKRSRIEESLRRAHENELIANLEPGAYTGGPRHFFKSLSEHHKVPYFAYTDWQNGKMRIERVPVFSCFEKEFRTPSKP